MLVAELLLKILNDMLKEEFQTFKWFLTLDILENCDPIPRSQLQDTSRTEVVDKLLKSYGEETAVKMTAEVLKKMSMNKALQELLFYPAGENDTNTQLTHLCCSQHCNSEKLCFILPCTGKSTQSSSSLSPSARAPPAVMTAQEGSVIIAPTITVGGTTSCNITISN